MDLDTLYIIGIILSKELFPSYLTKRPKFLDTIHVNLELKKKRVAQQELYCGRNLES